MLNYGFPFVGNYFGFAHGAFDDPIPGLFYHLIGLATR